MFDDLLGPEKKDSEKIYDTKATEELVKQAIDPPTAPGNIVSDEDPWATTTDEDCEPDEDCGAYEDCGACDKYEDCGADEDDEKWWDENGWDDDEEDDWDDDDENGFS